MQLKFMPHPRLTSKKSGHSNRFKLKESVVVKKLKFQPIPYCCTPQTTSRTFFLVRPLLVYLRHCLHSFHFQSSSKFFYLLYCIAAYEKNDIKQYRKIL